MIFQRDPVHKYSEFYTDTVSKHFSIFTTRLFLALGWSANSITYLMWITGVLGGLCLLSSQWEWRICGCFLMFMINVLDTSDGEVARYLGTCSPFGALLDKAVHFTTNQVVYSSFFVGLYLYDDRIGWLFLAIILNLVTTSDEILKELFVRFSGAAPSELKSSKLQLTYDKSSLMQKCLHVMFGPTGFYHLFVVFVFADIFFADSFGYRYFFEGLYVLSFVVVNTVKLVWRFRMVKLKIEGLNESL